MKGKYKGSTFAGAPGHQPGPNFDYLEECSNIANNINDYVSDKLKITTIEG